MAAWPPKKVFALTIYGEARGEPEEGQKWVGWVIKNRAFKNRAYWGGSCIKNVCLHRSENGAYQFECWKNWNGEVKEPKALQAIEKWSNTLFDAPMDQDPTGGADHYNNPDEETRPDWTERCTWLEKKGKHQFYKSLY